MQEICLGNIKFLDKEQVPPELRKLPYFEYICFDNEREDGFDETLYVGYSKTKRIYPNIDVLDNKIKDKTHWTPSFDERQDAFYDNICDFIFELPERYFSKYTHTHLCLNNYSIINKIDIDKMYMTKEKIIYILSQMDIYSLDLNIFQYFEIDLKTELYKIVENKEKLFKDPENALKQKLESIFKMDLIEKYVVTLI